MADTTQPTTNPMETLPPGTILHDRYRLDGVLGRGGFATVYRATQLVLQQEVAIKVLGNNRASKTVAERFIREAKLIATLEHPGMVRVIDFGVTEGEQAFLVMERLHGQPLNVWLRQHSPMDPGYARKLITGALDALQEAHDKGIVHRDLKPANLFVCHPGRLVESIRILDFGCAFLVDEDIRLTGTKCRLGTPQYMAPEYARDVHISPALDVYQMGLILAEMVAGQPVVPYDTQFAMIMTHCSGQLPIPDVVRHGPLWPVLQRALSFDPEQRYQDAGQFRDALQALTLPLAPPSPQRTTSPLWPALLGAALLTTFLLITAATATFFFWPTHSPPPEVTAPTEEAPKNAQNTEIKQEKPTTTPTATAAPTPAPTPSPTLEDPPKAKPTPPARLALPTPTRPRRSTKAKPRPKPKPASPSQEKKPPKLHFIE